MSERVALIGAGVMGQAIGRRLLESGHVLRVFDIDASRSEMLAHHGAKVHDTAAASAEESAFIILSLNSAKIVREAVFGESGVACNASAGTRIIDMSSIDPESTRELSTEAKTRSLCWIDCPLSGGAAKAAIGEMTVMAGGTEEDFAACRSVLDCLCSNLTLMGPVGAGQTTKLINQVLGALIFQAVAEATQLAIDAGVDASRIPAALSGGRADSAILQEYMPKMAARDYTPSGRLDNMLKDLMAVQDLARQTGTSMPMTAICTEVHRLLTTAGLGASDNAALMSFFDGPGIRN